VSDHTPGVPEHPASPEQPDDGFAEGEASPEVFPEDEEVGRFSEGQDHEPPGVTP